MFNKWIQLLLIVSLVGCQTQKNFDNGARSPSATTEPKAWSYEAGPEDSSMGKELVEINNEIPNMPELSMEIMGEQKFRPAFGPIPWRMLQQPNSVKILFIGQDGTHVAEAAGRPATAGFGGRAQDLANFFGVDYSAAFINTYSFTIKGQYGAFNTPYIKMNGGKPEVAFGGYTDNELWLMTHGIDSPINKWRNDLIEWIIRNNKDSLRMVVLFGGAARDAVSAFVISRGGKVGARISEESLKNIRMPETDLVFAGGNNEFPVPLDKEGNDVYAKLLGRTPDYSGKASDAEQKAAMDSLANNASRGMDEMVFTGGGLYGSGILHPAQLGGYDLDKIEINGKKTISLNGLKLSDGSIIKNDILIVDLPHPTALTNKQMDYEAWEKNPAGKKAPESPEEAVRKATTVLQPYRENGWRIEPDHGQENRFDQRLEYKYGRGYIGPEYYDFGTPNNRMVSVSDAVRHREHKEVIILGTRESSVPYDTAKLTAALIAQPAEAFPKEEMYIARPRTAKYSNSFDRGPGEDYAKLMKQNLDMAVIGAPKANVAADTDVKKVSDYDRNETIRAKFGSDAFNIKTDPVKVGDFGHYRGTFEKPRVVILADPDGVDDVLTSRALTGARGQFLHRMMKDIGVEDRYLVLKTVPFGMDGATEEEWANVLGNTKKYRDAVLGKVLREQRPVVAIADGPHAKKELERIINDIKPKLPIVSIQRVGLANNSGIVSAAKDLQKISDFKSVVLSGKTANIPRSHLPYYSRVWEGTSGDRVLDAISQPGLKIKKDSKGKVTFVPVHASFFKGLGFGVVAPYWATQQQAGHSKSSLEDILSMKLEMCEKGLRLPKESIAAFLSRSGSKPNCSTLVK
jgi:hypothetical protein